MTNSALKVTFAVGVLTLVLAVVLRKLRRRCGGRRVLLAGNPPAKASLLPRKVDHWRRGKYGYSSPAALLRRRMAPRVGRSRPSLSRRVSALSTVILSKLGTYAFKAENKVLPSTPEIDGKGVKSKGGEVGEANSIHHGQSSVLTVTSPGTRHL